MIDTEGFKEIDAAARMTKDKTDTEKWKLATQYWAYTQNVVLEKTCNVDFYNILTKRRCSHQHYLWAQNVQSIDEGTYTYLGTMS